MGSVGKEMSMKDIYKKFPHVAKTTVRGRVYENLGNGITRIGGNLYISTEAIVEQGNSLEIIDRMISEGDTFDMIFLDIPYMASGQRSGPNGNRNMFPLETISPEQFGEFVQKLHMLVKSNNTPIIFMFTLGKTSKKAHDQYLRQFEKVGFKQWETVGSYTKLWPNGKPMNMGKYPMPPEAIYIFNQSGEEVDVDLEFTMAPILRGYHTNKPIDMIKSLVKQFTRIGDWVFDPFGGSGVTLKACKDLRRKCHIIDVSGEAVEKYMLQII